MFALENYTKKMRDEMNVINEAKEEKRVYLEAAKKQMTLVSEQIKEQSNKQINQYQQQMMPQQPPPGGAAGGGGPQPMMGPPGQNVPQNTNATPGGVQQAQPAGGA